MRKAHLIPVLSVCAVVVVTLIVWFAGGLFYDVVFEELEKQLGITKAKAFWPAGEVVLALLVLWAVYQLGVKVTTVRLTRQPQPDLPISQAINHIVNESTAILKKPDPADSALLSERYGASARQIGVEHTDAASKVQEKLMSGEVTAWGYAEDMTTHRAVSYESVRRLIPVEYWETGRLFADACFYEGTMNQTLPQRRKPRPPMYSGLMLSKEQVMKIWPRKPWYARTGHRERIPSPYEISLERAELMKQMPLQE